MGMSFKDRSGHGQQPCTGLTETRSECSMLMTCVAFSCDCRQIAQYGWGSTLMTAQPGYHPPPLKDLVLLYIAFDVLLLDGRDLCSLPLQVCCSGRGCLGG